MQWLQSIANSYGVVPMYFHTYRRGHRPKDYRLNCFLWNVLFLCRWQNLVINYFNTFFFFAFSFAGGGGVGDMSSSSDQKQE